MATTEDYIIYVVDKIRNFVNYRYKKMFGEYMVYINEKPVLLVCDNTVYVKKHQQLEELLKDSDTGFPYNGAKEHYVLDIDNQELVDEVLTILEMVTPLPKKKTKESL